MTCRGCSEKILPEGSALFVACNTNPARHILNSYLLQFSSTLSNLLDKHAPLRTISCPSKTRQPFITQEIINEKKIRSRHEKLSTAMISLVQLRNLILISLQLDALPNLSLSQVEI